MGTVTEPEKKPWFLTQLNICKESKSYSNQHDRFPLYDRKEYTTCQILRTDAGAIQIHQTNGHGNHQYDS